MNPCRRWRDVCVVLVVTGGLCACVTRQPPTLTDTFVQGDESDVVPGDSGDVDVSVNMDLYDPDATPPRLADLEVERPAVLTPAATRLEDADPALATALVVAESRPSPAAHRKVAELYQGHGIIDMAYDHLLSAERLAPDDPATQDSMARLWRAAGWGGVGLGAAYRAAYQAPDSPAAHNTLGTILQDVGDHTAARGAYEQSLRLDPLAGYVLNNPPIRPSIEFTITDHERRLLEVGAEDLIVLEDGVEQTIEGFQEAADPVSIILALDSSGSMKPSAEAVMDAARSFVHSIREEDSLAVLTFADRPVFAHDLTTTREWSLDAIDEYTPIGGTALYDTVVDCLARLRRVDGRRVLVLLTDGRDEDNPGTGPGSLHTFGEALAKLRETEGCGLPDRARSEYRPRGDGEMSRSARGHREQSSTAGGGYFAPDK